MIQCLIVIIIGPWGAQTGSSIIGWSARPEPRSGSREPLTDNGRAARAEPRAALLVLRNGRCTGHDVGGRAKLALLREQVTVLFLILRAARPIRGRLTASEKRQKDSLWS